MTKPAFEKMADGLKEALEWAKTHEMTPEEIEAQRQSWVRAFAPCEHGKVDFEECPQCRSRGQGALK